MKFLNELFNTVWHWHQRRRSIANLQEMPDYLLADIGIERNEITEVVNNLQARGYAAQAAYSGRKSVMLPDQPSVAITRV